MLKIDFLAVLLLMAVCLIAWSVIGYQYGHFEGRVKGYRQCLGEQDDDRRTP